MPVQGRRESIKADYCSLSEPQREVRSADLNRDLHASDARHKSGDWMLMKPASMNSASTTKKVLSAVANAQ